MLVLTPAPAVAAPPPPKPPIEVVKDVAAKPKKIAGPRRVLPRPVAPAAPRPAAPPALDPAQTAAPPEPAAPAELIAIRDDVAALRAELRALLGAPASGEPANAEPAASRLSLPEELRRLSATVARIEARSSVAEAPPVASPKSRAPATTPRQDPPTPEPLGVGAEVLLATAYAFRGLNVFKDGAQSDQHALFSPSLSYAVPGTRLALAYAGFYQWTGPNQRELVAAGVGHEQDLVVSFTAKSGATSAVAALTYYAYPFAERSASGTRWPSYLEPSVTLTWSSAVDLGLQLLYFHGVQEAVAAGRYAYVHPSVTKSLALGAHTSLAVTVGAGYKDYVDQTIDDNVWDAHFDWKLTFALGGGGYIAPAVHYTWTNLAREDSGGEYLVWAGVASGVSL